VWRRSEIPAVNGHVNARSIALAGSVLACGGTVGSTQIMSPEGCEAVFRTQASGVDLVLGVPVTFGIGYALVSDDAPLSTNARTCYWGGWGGSMLAIDYASRTTVAYVMNQMQSGIPGYGLDADQRGGAIVVKGMRASAELVRRP
jgi:CubicO group peptidase (beta-lactamase class C family)